MKYVFIKPEDTIATNAKNIHIYESELLIIAKTPLCNNHDVNQKKDQYFTIVNDKKQAREKALELENAGKATCGQCVAKLYRDGK